MRKILLLTTLGIILFTLLCIFGVWRFSFSHIPDLFRLNKECQEEGYYMGEFEFKMLGLAYYLDKGGVCQSHQRNQYTVYAVANAGGVSQSPEIYE